jgi:hypothetical protein
MIAAAEQEDEAVKYVLFSAPAEDVMAKAPRHFPAAATAGTPVEAESPTRCPAF